MGTHLGGENGTFDANCMVILKGFHFNNSA